MNCIFCVAGQDARQQAATKALRRAGYEVVGGKEAARADCILLPVPADDADPALAALIRSARPGTTLMAGQIGPALRRAAGEAGLVTVNCYQSPELACLNAVPTAEGCLELLLRLRTRTIWESRFLVLGYGRIGRAVARRLRLLGGRVTVAARAADQRASARSADCRAVPLTALERVLPSFDAVINTIPAPVLGRRELLCLPKGALILDLASRPGGTDFAAARELGLHAELALGLPARCAPETAGELTAHAVLELLREREGRKTP